MYKEDKMIGALKKDIHFEDEFSDKKYEKNLEKIDTMIKSVLKGKMDFVDTSLSMEAIHCQRADGFIPSSYNKGGYEISGIVIGLENASDYCNDESGKERMMAIYNQSRIDCLSAYFDTNKSRLNIETIAQLEEYLKEDDDEDELFSDELSNYRDDECASFSIRIMYNGFVDNQFKFIVDSSINWEFPYFRDGKGCSVYREESIEESDIDNLEAILTQAVSSVRKLFDVK